MLYNYRYSEFHQSWHVTPTLLQEVVYVSHCGAVTPEICAMVYLNLFPYWQSISKAVEESSRLCITMRDYLIQVSAQCVYLVFVCVKTPALFRIATFLMEEASSDVFRILIATDSHLGYRQLCNNSNDILESRIQLSEMTPSKRLNSS